MENDLKEEKEYAEILARDYVKTRIAKANPAAKDQRYTGAWPKLSEFPEKLRAV